MRSDLHIHSLESDGSLPVQAIIEQAHKNGVKVISLTDHETTNGVIKAQEVAKNYDMQVIPGVELVTAYREQEIHLLGYFASVENFTLQNRLKELRERRTALAYTIVKNLQRDGYTIKWSDVELEANVEGAVSKGHIMRVLYNLYSAQGQNVWREIAGFFQPGGKAYLPFLEHSFEEAVDFIYAVRGVPVLAHPGLIGNNQIVYELLELRQIGLEVYYGYWEKQQEFIEFYAEVADKFATFITGGSDFHGSYSKVQIGQMKVPYRCVFQLIQFLQISRPQIG